MVLGHLIEEAAEELGMLCLFPQEGGEKHLLLDMSILSNRHNQRQQVEGHTLLASLKKRRLQQQRLLLVLGAALPIYLILRKIDTAWIPGAKLLCLVIEPHRKNIV